MSMLLLRIDKRLEVEHGRAPRVPVKIYRVDQSGETRKTKSIIQASIAVSDRDEDATPVSVKAGRYYVESVLPSGETLAEDVSVGEAQTKRLVLRGESVQADWLSWQDFSGNPILAAAPAAAPERLILLTDVKGDAPLHSLIRRIRTIDRMPEALRDSESPRLVRATSPADRVNLNAPIGFLDQPAPQLSSQGAPTDVWHWLAHLRQTPKAAALLELNGGAPTAPINAFAHDKFQAVFRIDPGTWRTLSSKKPSAIPERRFAVVSRGRSLELLSLPMPWLVHDAPREATVEVGVRQDRTFRAFCSSVIVRDSEFGVLLSYLSAGALPTAQTMAKPALDFLRYKYRNPFAAAAGGYALVGTLSLTRKETWHQWIWNLMEHFPRVPDGAILWARLKLSMRRDAADLKEAAKALKVAYRRGIPFYSLGVKWLMEGLEIVSRKDPEALRMLSAVQPIAWHIHYQQPFTILRIARSKHV